MSPMLRLRHEGWRRAKEVVMVRVRLMGLPKEVRRIADAMESTGCVIERSEEYPISLTLTMTAEIKQA